VCGRTTAYQRDDRHTATLTKDSHNSVSLWLSHSTRLSRRDRNETNTTNTRDARIERDRRAQNSEQQQKEKRVKAKRWSRSDEMKGGTKLTCVYDPFVSGKVSMHTDTDERTERYTRDIEGIEPRVRCATAWFFMVVTIEDVLKAESHRDGAGRGDTPIPKSTVNSPESRQHTHKRSLSLQPSSSPEEPSPSPSLCPYPA
jgi:hypothetical protein